MGMPAKDFIPVIEITVEPLDRADWSKLLAALSELSAEDVQFKFTVFDENHMVLAGIDEIQIDRKIDALRNNYGMKICLGPPQIAFRETITRSAEVSYVHKKQTGGTGQFAGVSIVVEPIEPGKGYEFESKIVRGAVPKEYIPGVEKGLNSVLGSGVAAGFPVVDVKVQLVDGKYHDLDSSVLAFEIASRAAFREALQKGEPVLLEPIMKVEIRTPEDCSRRIFDDLKLRRGHIKNRNMIEDEFVIIAEVPATNMFGYFNSLRSISDGRASHTSQFERYAPVPPFDDPPFAPAIGMRI
jgi:elongation factor G